MGVGRGPVTPSDLCKAGLVVSTAEMLGCLIIKYLAGAGCAFSSLKNEVLWVSGEPGRRLRALRFQRLKAVLCGWVTNVVDGFPFLSFFLFCLFSVCFVSVFQLGFPNVVQFRLTDIFRFKWMII